MNTNSLAISEGAIEGKEHDVDRARFALAFGQRCKAARGVLGAAEVADVLGVNRNTIWNIERGKSLPDAFLLEKMARLYQTSVQGLLHGVSSSYDDEEFDLVEMLDVRVSAGAGSLNGDHEVIGRFAFARSWLARKGVQPTKAKIIRARGHSMADRINDGDILLVDTTVNQMQEDGVYVIERDGMDYVKLLQKDFVTGGVHIISYNPDYPTQILDSNQVEDLRISGRVVWHGGDV